MVCHSNKNDFSGELILLQNTTPGKTQRRDLSRLFLFPVYKVVKYFVDERFEVLPFVHFAVITH